LLLLPIGCGSGQSAPTEQAPEKSGGFWLSRSGEPAADATILSIDEPLIQSDGHIDLPAGELAASDETPKPKPGRRTGRPSPKSRGGSSGDTTKPGTANRWQSAEPWLVNRLIGRNLQRGERAFVRAADVKFYAPTPTDKLHVPVSP
jgi:hypothetical protein